MPYILRLFGTWVLKILENFAWGYQKGGNWISYDTGEEDTLIVATLSEPHKNYTIHCIMHMLSYDYL